VLLSTKTVDFQKVIFDNLIKLEGGHMVKKVVVVAFALFIAVSGIFAQTVVYYDPDGNIKRIFDINAQGNKVFGAIGVKFIAAADEKSFRAAMDLKPDFVIINSLVYLREREVFSLEPIGILVRKGKYVYQKKIVSFLYSDLDSLNGKVISSSLEEAVYTIGGGIRFRLLKVPKDLDALLAVKFRQADGAMVSEDSLEIFKAIDPTSFQNLKFVFSTKGIYNPVVCITRWGNEKDKERVLNVLSTAKELLTIMGFDSVSDDEKILSKLR
jgi:hypothetical protein